MEQTDLKYLRVNQSHLNRNELEDKLPELGITHAKNNTSDMQNLDTFWQETILDIHNSSGDFLNHKVKNDNQTVDRRALTLSWLSAHEGGQKRRIKKRRNRLQKSKSLEKEGEDADSNSDDEFHHLVSSDILKARSSENLVSVTENEIDSETEGHSRLLPQCRTLNKNRREVRSDYDITNGSKATRRSNVLRHNEISDSEDSLPSAYLTSKQHLTSPVLLPNLPISRRSTPLSPLYLEGRLSPTGSLQGQSISSSPLMSPVLTPGRHRQFHFLLSTELPSSNGSKSLPGGAQSLPSSPRIGKKRVVLAQERTKDSVNSPSGKSDFCTPLTHRPQSEALSHQGSTASINRGILSARGDRSLSRPDTPILKLRCRTVSGLRDGSSRMYSSCSDLPKVDEK